VGSAVAVAGLALGPTTVLWAEVVSWTVGVLEGLGVLVRVEQPAEAATMPTTAATNNPGPGLTAGRGEAPSRFIVDPLLDIELAA